MEYSFNRVNLIIIFCLLAMPAVNGQEDTIVIDDLTASQLRAEIVKIENEFYRVFNLSTKNDNLKIECSEYSPTGSHIKQRACEPNFYKEARNKNVRNWQDEIEELASPSALRSSLEKEFEELTSAMNNVLKESEYFRELNSILRMLRERQDER